MAHTEIYAALVHLPNCSDQFHLHSPRYKEIEGIMWWLMRCSGCEAQGWFKDEG